MPFIFFLLSSELPRIASKINVVLTIATFVSWCSLATRLNIARKAMKLNIASILRIAHIPPILHVAIKNENGPTSRKLACMCCIIYNIINFTFKTCMNIYQQSAMIKYLFEHMQSKCLHTRFVTLTRILCLKCRMQFGCKFLECQLRIWKNSDLRHLQLLTIVRCYLQHCITQVCCFETTSIQTLPSHEIPVYNETGQSSKYI